MIPKAYEAVFNAVEIGELDIDASLDRIHRAKEKWLRLKEDGPLITFETQALLNISPCN
jgi:hypothetical protein